MQKCAIFLKGLFLILDWKCQDRVISILSAKSFNQFMERFAFYFLLLESICDHSLQLDFRHLKSDQFLQWSSEDGCSFQCLAQLSDLEKILFEHGE